MKGFSVQNGVEFRIVLEGERWTQGGTVAIEVTSRPGQPLKVAIAEGSERKIKAKDASAFAEIESRDGAGPSLKTQFELPRNSRITDKSGSLYVLYGDPGKPANLKLIVDPHPWFGEICEVLVRHYRFSLKSTSMGKKGKVELKLEPSGAKEWASLTHLIASLSLEEDALELTLEFHRTVVNALKPGLTAEKAVGKFHRSLPVAEIIHSFNQRLNPEAVILSLDAMMEEYRSRGWL
ncbi:MAG: hypothetical protein EBX52_01845 [Proteobacteria bacterium]|nr:hypothetical protein [Pseudomonadota bacterium]